MNHHIYHVLSAWAGQRDAGNWLLATIINTEGSSYRKAGAMMLFSQEGAQLGVVSGGCLESDLLHQARRCWETGESRIVTYDMQEEGDIAWRLGIGCGGEVTLLLQPVNADNDYIGLQSVLDSLQQQQSIWYSQPARAGQPAGLGSTEKPSNPEDFCCELLPPPTLGIAGGGVDAMPLCDMAARLGWRVIVNDSRARYARAGDFKTATSTTDLPAGDIAQAEWFHQLDALIVMHHQVRMDGETLTALANDTPASLKYLALLGPSHRAERVLSEADLTEDSLPLTLHAPAGIAIGGELPESIALSMLAQAHAVLHGKSGSSLKGRPCQSD